MSNMNDNFNKAAIRSSANVIYSEMVKLLGKQYPDYKPLFSNKVMKGLLYQIFVVALDQTLEMCGLKNDVFKKISEQLKVSGVSFVALGGIDFGQELVNNFAKNSRGLIKNVDLSSITNMFSTQQRVV